VQREGKKSGSSGYEGFRMHREKDMLDEVALLSNKSEIEIILCDKKGYAFYDYRYLIKSGSGLLGWSDYKTISGHVSLHTAD
jgi:hypothetical protein